MLLGAARSRVEAKALAKSGDAYAIRVSSGVDAIEERTREKPSHPAMVEVGAGNELVPHDVHGYVAPVGLKDTVADPDYVSLEASRERLELLHGANCLELALDAVDSAGAKNPVEAMLLHQMAAAHASSMKLAPHVDRLCERLSSSIDPSASERWSISRNGSSGWEARLMQAYQGGAATLAQVRRGGTQRVVVQHTYVAEGGRAVVAGGGVRSGAGKRSRQANVDS